MIGRCQDRANMRQAARTRQCAGEFGANACPPRCIAAGYSPDNGKIEFASLAKIKTALNIANGNNYNTKTKTYDNSTDVY